MSLIRACAWRLSKRHTAEPCHLYPSPFLAILDDYLGISESHFAHISPETLSLSIFRDYLLPYTVLQTIQAQKHVKALYEPLRKGSMGCATLDVSDIEPLLTTSPWRS